MRAVIRRNGQLIVDTCATPIPGAGEVLVKTLACGICGSDLHMHRHCDVVIPAMKRAIPASALFDPTKDVVFGHEFCAELVDYGPGAQRSIKLGKRVCALPVIANAAGVGTVGYLNQYPGGFGEFMVLQEQMLVEVPDSVSTEIAALTEPLAVAAHAVNKANLRGGEAILVIGCGAIGLATIAVLKARGIGPVVASDFSPARRGLAEKLGADVIVDPQEKSPYQSWFDVGAPQGYDPQGVAALLGLGPQPKPCVIFECVGVPGVLSAIFASAPLRSRIVVVGVCMQADSFEPIQAISKELSVEFSYAYTPGEFADTLGQLATGVLQPNALITSTIALADVPAAFDDTDQARQHAKIMIKHH